MARHPEDRYASARALADDVERWLADEPVSAYREPWTARVALVACRKTAVSVAAVAVLAAAAGLGVVAVRERRSNRTLARALARAEDREGLALRSIENYRKAIEENPDLMGRERPWRPLRWKLLEAPQGFYRQLKESKTNLNEGYVLLAQLSSASANQRIETRDASRLGLVQADPNTRAISS